MTPNDIATSIAGLGPVVEQGNIAMSTNYTHTFERMDDANSWD